MSSRIPVFRAQHGSPSTGNKSPLQEVEQIDPLQSTMQLRSKKILQTASTKPRIRSATVTKHKGLPTANRGATGGTSACDALTTPQSIHQDSSLTDDSVESKLSTTKLLTDAVARVFRDAKQFSPIRSPQRTPKKLSILHMALDKENTPPAKTSQEHSMLMNPSPRLLHSTPAEKYIRIHKSRLPRRTTAKWNTKSKRKDGAMSTFESDGDVTHPIIDSTCALHNKLSDFTLNRTYTLDDQAGCVLHGSVKIDQTDLNDSRVPEVLTQTSSEFGSDEVDSSELVPVTSNVVGTLATHVGNGIAEDGAVRTDLAVSSLNGDKGKDDEVDKTLPAKRRVTFEEPAVNVECLATDSDSNIVFDFKHLPKPKASYQPLQVFSPTRHRLAQTAHYNHEQSCRDYAKSDVHTQVLHSNTPAYITSTQPTKLCTHTTTTAAFLRPLASTGSVIPPMNVHQARPSILPPAHPSATAAPLSYINSTNNPVCEQCTSTTTSQFGWETTPMHDRPTIPQLQLHTILTSPGASDAASPTDLEVAGLTESLFSPDVLRRVLRNPVASSVDSNSRKYTFQPIHVPVRIVIKLQGSAFSRIMWC